MTSFLLRFLYVINSSVLRIGEIFLGVKFQISLRPLQEARSGIDSQWEGAGHRLDSFIIEDPVGCIIVL